MVIGDRAPTSPAALQRRRSASCSASAAGSVRQLSGTSVPDATSGFRAFSRRAALRLNVFTDFTYTLETIIQAGKKHIPIAHVPIDDQSRAAAVAPVLARVGLPAALGRRRMVRIYALYEPLKVFWRPRRRSALGGGVDHRHPLPRRLPRGDGGAAHPEPDPRRGAAHRRLPDHADRPRRRPDRRATARSLEDTLAARARARAAARRRARRRRGWSEAVGAGRAPAQRAGAGAARDDGRASSARTTAPHSANRLLRAGASPAPGFARRRAARAAVGGDAARRDARYFARGVARRASRALGRRPRGGWRAAGATRRGRAAARRRRLRRAARRAPRPPRVCRPRARARVRAAREPDRDAGRGSAACSAPAARGARARAALDRATCALPPISCSPTPRRTPTTCVALGRRAQRVAVWHLGVEPEFCAPAAASRVEPRRVLFYGRYLPLHGIDDDRRGGGRALGERADVRADRRGPGARRASRRSRRTLGARIEWRDEVPLAALPGELAARGGRRSASSAPARRRRWWCRTRSIRPPRRGPSARHAATARRCARC